MSTLKRSEIWHLVRPRSKRVWGYPIFKEEAEEISPGGIILANVTSKKLQQTLEVIRVAEDVPDISEGDIVLLESNAGGEVISLTDDNGEIHNIFVINEKFISAVIEG